ncbi:MAG: arylsulfatase, partial [Planctomycetaceae bacterium]
TRASLMTGRYHYRTGVIHTSRGGAKMFGDEITLAEILSGIGYRTGIFGKWHLGDNYPMRPQDQGFAESLVHRSGGIGQTPDRPNSYFHPKLLKNGHMMEAAGYCTDVFFNAALEFIEENKDEPFFAFVPLNAPHTPLEVSAEAMKPYLEKGLDETTARVYGMVQNIDENFGRLLSKLENLNLRDNTLVIFLSDNGAQQKRFNAGLRGRKASVYEGGIRVPCFIQWPARLAGNRQLDSIAAHIDLLPTLVEACTSTTQRAGGNRDLFHEIDGVSLLPLLMNPAAVWPNRTLFFQCHRGLSPQPLQNAAVVTQQYKLILSPDTFSRENFSSPDEAVFELFDLVKDRSESNDLGTEKPDIVQQLTAAYSDWFRIVRGTRNFSPGIIQIGAAAQERIHLCRYQDATFQNGRPMGWDVRVLEKQTFEMKITRGSIHGPLDVEVFWQKQRVRQKLNGKQNQFRILLRPGQGLLSVTLHDRNGKEIVLSDNGVSGDITLTPWKSARR